MSELNSSEIFFNSLKKNHLKKDFTVKFTEKCFKIKFILKN